MKKGKRVIAVLLYILAVALLLGLRPKELFDLRQFLLVIAGGMILYLPTMEKEDFRRATAFTFQVRTKFLKTTQVQGQL